MNIISDYNQDIRSKKPVPGSYEWWYFDAISDDGTGIVIIFYDGNPFSKRYINSIDRDKQTTANSFPALSISVYKKGAPVYYGFHEVAKDNAHFSEEKPTGNVGQSNFSGEITDGKLSYVVNLNQSNPNGDSIKGNLTFSSAEFNGLLNGSNVKSADQKHSWNLIQPRAAVHGQIDIQGHKSHSFNFDGVGYHDHNVGHEPMKNSFHEWYWGRYHFEDSTLIYYLMNSTDGWDKKGWLITKSGEIEESSKVELKENGTSLFGLSSYRTIEFEGAGFKAFLQKDRLIDNGPFYQRFSGTMILERNSKIKRAIGISEYIFPSRIYNRLFWPLVDMRINYPGKTHWVQRSPVLYRWTW